MTKNTVNGPYLNFERTAFDDPVEGLVPRIDHQLEDSLVVRVVRVLLATDT